MNRNKWKKTAVILLAAFSVQLAGCGDEIAGNSAKHIAGAIVTAEYPNMAKYPKVNAYGDVNDKDYSAWRASRKAQEPENTEYQEGMQEFYLETIPEFLRGAEGKNRIYSPLNVYMALAMLAETTAGKTQTQILNILHTETLESLRDKAKTLWNANYCDDGTVTSLLASSVWLSDSVQYNKEVLETLAATYYASSFSGEMGSEQYNKSLQEWLNDQTGDLLKEQASNISLDPITVFALATTVNFQAKWVDEFNSSQTEEELFHTETGEISCEFMKQSDNSEYYWGEKFSAVYRNLQNSGTMLFILPDEEITAEELLADEETLNFMTDYRSWENSKSMTINQSIPKFDVASNFDFRELLKNLGATDVLSMEKADFTPLTMEPDVHLHQATHAARVMIDEEGCQAVAFTVMESNGSSMPPEEEIDFVLNRPFLFVIYGQDRQPLVVGIVNQP